MLKIRRPLGRLIFNMGIAIPGKTVFLIETAPRTCNYSKKSIQYFLLRLGTASNNYYRGNVDRSFSIEAILMYENTLAWKFHDMVRELHHSILDSPRRGLVMQSFDFFFPLLWGWTTCWRKNRVAGDVRHHDTHVTSLMSYLQNLTDFLVETVRPGHFGSGYWSLLYLPLQDGLYQVLIQGLRPNSDEISGVAIDDIFIAPCGEFRKLLGQ